MHKEAVNTATKEELGIKKFTEQIVEKLRSQKDSHEWTKRIKRRLLFDLILHIIYVNERPFSDFPTLLELQEQNGVKKFNESYRSGRAAVIFSDCIGESLKLQVFEALTQANYFSVLSHGSTDKGVTEDEVVLYTWKRMGERLYSFDNPESVDADGIIDFIYTAFERIGIINFRKKLYAVNFDGGSVNLGCCYIVEKWFAVAVSSALL